MTAAIHTSPNCGRLLGSEWEFDEVLHRLVLWLEERDYAGYEPYDLLNSKYLGGWARRQPFATFFVQSGKRFGGEALRRALRVPPSRNAKALGLLLAAYCDLKHSGWNTGEQAAHVRRLLLERRSPGEGEFCWGYDWHYVSLRGARLPAHSPNSVATVFCADALLHHAETFYNIESRSAALSAARWLCTSLRRSVDTPQHLCFSYTPDNRTKIFNNSVLIGAFLTRLDALEPLPEHRATSLRTMQFLVDHQADDGSWLYGLGRSQNWIDHFHTGYNLGALLDYQQLSGDCRFQHALMNGYEYYKRQFFTAEGVPKYFDTRTYPVDIHACSQAILTFCAFRGLDPKALERAHSLARWTVAHFLNQDGSFGYQMHRFHKDPTPYVRWSQAWMLRALARLRRELA